MGSDEKQELLGIKWKHAILIGRKGYKSTPSPTWKLGFDCDSSSSSHPPPNFPMKNSISISARKMGANLWEGQTQFGGGDTPSHRHRRHHSHEKEGFGAHDQQGEESPDRPPQPPETETSLRRNIRETPSLRHLSVEKNGQNLQNVSSASYCSSMEVTPYTPTGSLKGRFGEPKKSLKTSTHLLKVLNRIWSLEEQNSHHTGLVKALKRELENSQAQIKTLLQERKRDHQEIDELKRSTQENMKKSTQATREELEVERKLRRHSESLHHKLSRELSEARSSFSRIVKELKREKKARILLESLCDEFAKGIRDYDRKVRFLQQNPEKKDETRNKNGPDSLILHVSEAWLDERMQMKLAEAKFDFSEKKSISDNLSFEIETFLQAKHQQSGGSGVVEDTFLGKHEQIRPCRRSLESNDEISTGNVDVQSTSMKKKGPQKPETDLTVRELMSKTTVPDPGAAETSSRQGQAQAQEGVKENSLKAKLLEARLESQLARSRTMKK